MIEIVKFERNQNKIEIGFRQGEAVVYTTVFNNLTDDEAKQRAFEQVWRTLEYEQTLEEPSFSVSDIADEEGNVIPYEKFISEEPKINKIEIIGDRVIQFAEGQEAVTKDYTVKLTDQYGEPIEKEVTWYGADNGILTVNNEQQENEIKAECDGIEASIIVQVYPYVEPEPSELELLSNYVLDVDMRLIMMELGL